MACREPHRMPVLRDFLFEQEGRLVTFSGEDILPGIQAVTLPSHAPGHTGYLIGVGAEFMLIWGDIVHFPHIQAAQPEVTIAFDSDPAQAACTRNRALDQVATDRLTVIGMHFNLPQRGRSIGMARLIRWSMSFGRLRCKVWQQFLLIRVVTWHIA